MKNDLEIEEIETLSDLIEIEIKEFNSDLYTNPDEVKSFYLKIQQKLDLQYLHIKINNNE
tara:strand:- start:234 stop:413 length:180 start_codon:yes stop_codon:yes gene_type:complete